MINVKLSAGAIALVFAAVPAGAQIVSIAEPANAAGDLATDQEGLEPIYLPAFNPALGTLLSTSLSVQGVLDWSEPFITSPTGTEETILTMAASPLTTRTSTPLALKMSKGRAMKPLSRARSRGSSPSTLLERCPVVTIHSMSP
jgi:hypothetical protein